jgi:hypothetical protein
VDDRLRHAYDKPTIGLILCQDKNRIIAEYALKGVQKAFGVIVPSRAQWLAPGIRDNTTASVRKRRHSATIRRARSSVAPTIGLTNALRASASSGARSSGISFDYSDDALLEFDHFFRTTGKVIVPLTVREILDEHIAKAR